MTDASGPPSIPAATVVVVRDGPDGLETLMLRRNPHGDFGGMWVFPGGKVDAGDGDDELTAARQAAVREAAEEAALALELSSLVPLAHWLPPTAAPKRFATWFFVATAGAEEVQVDGGEIHEHAWLSPAEVLSRRDAGEVELAPPTWVTLHELGAHRSASEVMAWASSRDPEFFLTRIARVEEALVAMWREDAGYDDGDPTRIGRRHRLNMGAIWSYERG